MSFSSVGDLLTDTHNSSSTSWTTTATLSRTLNVGQLGVIVLTADNIVTTDLASSMFRLSDSVGNTWYKARGFTNGQGSAGAGAVVAIWWTIATVQLPTNGTFTIALNQGAVTAKALVGWVFDIDAGTGFLAVDAGLDLANDAADAGSQAISGLSSVERLYVRGIAAERSVTTFTPTSGFTSIGNVSVGSGAAGMNALGEFKIATSTGETSDPTTTAVDQASVFVAFREVPRATTVIPKRLGFGWNTANQSAYTTDPFTPGAATRVNIWVYSEAAASAAAPTISGYTQVISQLAGTTARLTWFSLKGAPAAPSGVSIDFGGQTQIHCEWIIEECESAGSIVQSAGANAATVSLSAFASSGNAAVACVLSGANGLGPDTGWTGVGDATMFEVIYYPLVSMWRPDDGDLSPSASGGAMIVAGEIAFAHVVTLGQASETDAAQPVGKSKARALGQASETDAAQAISGGIVELAPRTTLLIPPLEWNTGIDIAAISRQWFRNGILPSANMAKRLADTINMMLAQRMRVMFAHSNLYGLHADFDTGTNSDIATWRFACHTGPVTKQLRCRMLFLPLPQGATPAGAPAAQWTMISGLSGGSSTVHPAMTTPLFSATADFTARELFAVEQLWDVLPDTSYRFELHLTNRCRPVSGTVYEVPRTLLYTDLDACIDSTAIYQGGPITQQTLAEILSRAEDLWRLGQPLGHWTIDQPGDERSRTTATARNIWDQSVATPTALSPGWPVSVPYSGTLDSEDVPVTMWAYASAVSGTSVLTWRDQAGSVIGTVNPAGAAGWYSTTGVLQDRRGAAETTKLDLFLEGDGTNAAKVFAAGAFVHAEAA